MKRIRSFMQSPKFPGFFDASTVLMMSINKRVNEAHYHDSILKASQKNTGDQVMEKMASPRKRRSMLPNRGKQIVQQRTLVVMRERVGFIRASNSTRLFLSFSVKSVCRSQPVANDAQKTNSKSRTRGTRRKFHVRQNLHNAKTTDRSKNLEARKEIGPAKSCQYNSSRSKVVAAFCFLSCGTSSSLPLRSR